MKNLFKTGLLGAVLLISVVINAAEEINVRVYGAKSLNVSLSGVSSGVLLSIEDNRMFTLFSEKSNDVDSFVKNFDLTNLPEGLYYLKAKTSESVKVTPFIVDSKQAKIITGEIKTYNKPIFKFEKDILKLLVNNKNNNKVNVSIYANNSSIPIIDENFTTSEITKSYSFSSLPHLEYKVTVYQGEYSYTKTIKR